MLDSIPIPALTMLAILIVLIAGPIVFYLKNRIMVPTDEAAIIYGLKNRIIDPKTGYQEISGTRIISKGGGTFVWPRFEKVTYLNLRNIHIPLNLEGLMCKNGIKLDVDAVAIIKVADDEYSIRKAATQFGDTRDQTKRETQIEILSQTLQGHFREIISTLTPEELHEERAKFNQNVQEAAGEPLSAMGMEIISFTIQNISDNEKSEKKYLDLLKLGNIAEKEELENTRQSSAQKREKEKITLDELRKMELDEELGSKKEDLRFRLEQSRIGADKLIDLEKIQTVKATELAERDRSMDVLKVDIDLKEVQKIDKVKEADLMDVEKTIRAIEIEKHLLDFDLEGKGKVILAEAEAEAIRLKLEAEAEGKRKLAEVYENADELTRLLLVIDKMPEIIEKVLGKDGFTSIFREIATPLSNIDNLNIYDFGNGSRQESRSPLVDFAETSPLLLKKMLFQLKDLGVNLDVETLVKKFSRAPQPENFSGPEQGDSENDITLPALIGGNPDADG